MTSLSGLTTQKKRLIADLSILLSAMLWGGDYIFAKKALDSIDPGYLNAVRFTIVALVLLLIIRKRLKNISRRDVATGALTGFMMFGGFAGQTIGLKYTSVGNNAFLTSTYVIFVPFLAWIISRKKPANNNFAAVIVCIAGIYLMTMTGGSFNRSGDLITLSGALFFGFELALLGYYAKKMDPLILAFLEATAVALFFWCYSVIFEQPPATVSRDLIISLSYVTFFGSVLTHIIVTIALKYTSSSHGAILCSTEALFGLLLSVIFLGEMLSLQGWIGASIVLISVVITETGEEWFKREKAQPEVR